MKGTVKGRVALGALALLTLAGGGAAETLVRPAGRSGVVVIPDQFLRRWDPVTVFFERDAGPAEAGPEDDPDRFVKMQPAHPGAFRWLDARTLQFRPAEPWPPLRRFTWEADGQTATLATLMSSPVQTVPSPGSTGLGPVEQVSLAFPEPLDVEALARMLSVELRPLPGVGSDRSRFLNRDDFDVKTLERASRSDRATYVVGFHAPIPLGTRAVVHLRLSLDDDARSFHEVAFQTAEPFRVTSLGCRERRSPVAPEGTRYSREQALACGGQRRLVVEFSAPPAALGPIEGRNLVRLSPAVEDLAFELEGRTVAVAGDFAWDTLYELALAPAALSDVNGRPLEVRGRSSVFLYFPRQPSFVRWVTGHGIVERLGPQRVPIEGRGQERVDLRIHAVDPLDRSFWPFPERPVQVDESKRPPGPGEEPPPHTDPWRPIRTQELEAQIAALGSPPVSAIVDLPLRREGSAASFGLDLAPHLTRAVGSARPGTYLVGLRDLSGPAVRAWMRVQVTDLSLTTYEEAHAVRFVVTSLSTGAPVQGARVRVEGSDGEWRTFADGTTDASGAFRWPAPGGGRSQQRQVGRIAVNHGADTLVLDPQRPPDVFAQDRWSASHEAWLGWTLETLDWRGPQPETLAHVFTERPVYRPEEEVHIKGWLRTRDRGRLKPVALEGWVVVYGPGELEWKYPVTLGETGGFYHRFQEPDLPTGTYSAHLEDRQRQNAWGHVSFRVDAYRIPRFEVQLHGPDETPLDRPFDVSLTARYYAGGKVNGQPVQWRVTQFPLTWTPKPRPGFLYSSDARFSRGEAFPSTPRLERTDVTDESGAALLALDPTVETTAQPRQYVVEATVTGPDDQTVTSTRQVRALPPFVLGLKAPRFLERATTVTPEVLAVGSDGEPLPGLAVTVRLLRREWHSHLRASDFSDGVARYVTEVVDVPVSETQVTSTDDPLSVPLSLDRSGVYVIELEARDRLDRAQVVQVDLYAGGDQPVAWQKPTTRVFAVATDAPDYDPGAEAALVLQSPFQSARALAVIETPDGNRYEWLEVRGGAATLRLPIEASWAPRLPVHFVLMRGRLQGTEPVPGSLTDLGKPTTLASTVWLQVNPVANRVDVALRNPATALPGQEIEVEVTLRDPAGTPLPGEVTLWLVDQAVLALGKEQRLDPLPDFLTAADSHLEVRDTRNLAFGDLPFAERPGGDGAEEEAGLLDRATVRRDFRSVPYFEPALRVGPDGRLLVRVKLPDNLTNFKLRAKAASGPERFGVATGRVSVRLPLIVQPALPRFVRPGDRFEAAAIGRIVEGRGGPGAAEIRVEGLRLEGSGRQDVRWTEGRPERLAFPVQVETPPPSAQGALARPEVVVRVGVERASDGASDAFEVRLPVRPDRERETRRTLLDLAPDQPVAVEAIGEPVRPGTLRRSVLLSTEPGIVRLAAGLDFLLEYPYGCTEQQLSRARAWLALRHFRSLLGSSESEEALDRAVRETLEWIPAALDGSGRVAYWPGADGYVSLTAWSLQFVIEAREAGLTVDEALVTRLATTLEQALRSDYSGFVDGAAFMERAWALSALAQAGRFDSAYAAELARRAQFLDLEGVAQVLTAFARAGESSATTERLGRELWEGVVFRLHQGREIYGGLQTGRPEANLLILPSETRTLGEVTRALARTAPDETRLPVLVQGLVTLGRGDGWGDTNANAAALLALSERLEPGVADGPQARVELTASGRTRPVSVGGAEPVARLDLDDPGPAELRLAAGTDAAVAGRVVSSWIAAADGSQAAAQSRGFVVTRELLRVQPDGAPPIRVPLSDAGSIQELSVGDVVEDHLELTNPHERHYVAVVVPLAAGMEPLNPHLATAPPEARPAGGITLPPTYAAYLDDRVAFYYDTLPAGSYHFYFRTRATTPGSYVQPAAHAEMMYDAAVRGRSNGARIEVTAPEGP